MSYKERFAGKCFNDKEHISQHQWSDINEGKLEEGELYCDNYPEFPCDPILLVPPQTRQDGPKAQCFVRETLIRTMRSKDRIYRWDRGIGTHQQMLNEEMLKYPYYKLPVSGVYVDEAAMVQLFKKKFWVFAVVKRGKAYVGTGGVEFVSALHGEDIDIYTLKGLNNQGVKAFFHVKTIEKDSPLFQNPPPEVEANVEKQITYVNKLRRTQLEEQIEEEGEGDIDFLAEEYLFRQEPHVARVLDFGADDDDSGDETEDYDPDADEDGIIFDPTSEIPYYIQKVFTLTDSVRATYSNERFEPVGQNLVENVRRAVAEEFDLDYDPERGNSTGQFYMSIRDDKLVLSVGNNIYTNYDSQSQTYYSYDRDRNTVFIAKIHKIDIANLGVGDVATSELRQRYKELFTKAKPFIDVLKDDGMLRDGNKLNDIYTNYNDTEYGPIKVLPRFRDPTLLDDKQKVEVLVNFMHDNVQVIDEKEWQCAGAALQGQLYNGYRIDPVAGQILVDDNNDCDIGWIPDEAENLTEYLAELDENVIDTIITDYGSQRRDFEDRGNKDHEIIRLLIDHGRLPRYDQRAWNCALKMLRKQVAEGGPYEIYAWEDGIRTGECAPREAENVNFLDMTPDELEPHLTVGKTYVLGCDVVNADDGNEIHWEIKGKLTDVRRYGNTYELSFEDGSDESNWNYRQIYWNPDDLYWATSYEDQDDIEIDVFELVE